jgi:primosomal protein N' (replication factor Y)
VALFVDVILPLALNKLLTYAVPLEWEHRLEAGMRVKVSVGKNSYTALVRRLHHNQPADYAVKPLAELLDETPTVNETQLLLWEKIADYYLCSVGEVMKSALPNGLRKTYRPLTEACIRLHPAIASEEQLLACVNTLKRATKQEALLMQYLSFAEKMDFAHPHEVPKKWLVQDNNPAALLACIKKNILAQTSREVGRLNLSAVAHKALPALSPAQARARHNIAHHFDAHKVVLLHGITASGKTEIYIDLMAEQLQQGKEVLYLLPEIALTTQIVERLQGVFGNTVGVYHSRYNDNERAEIYNAIPSPYRIILGARSALFLPFSKLGLIIVDEEHETTYKQCDPAPRYHARDAAIMLAQLHGANILLGTATPSIESFYNAQSGKYGLVSLTERFHQAVLPEVEIVDIVRARKKKQTTGLFSFRLQEAIGEALEKKEQIILFQNRRGFSPFVQCADCGYIPHCQQCSVSFTYHKQHNELLCHYCGTAQKLPATCPECHSPNIQTKGFGTEKAEDELQLLFPQARIARLDVDATRSKQAYSRILGNFARRSIDILVGTQMVTKGLDFEHVSLVGILHADNMLNFPDFRAYERSFQLMTQVSGRAGRQAKQGRVIIQTGQPDNPIIHLVKEANYTAMFNRQLIERKEFHFPPYSRLLSITLKHHREEVLMQAAGTLKQALVPALGQRLTGPFQPMVNRIQNRYLLCFWVRLEKHARANDLKKRLAEQAASLLLHKGFSGIILTIDVDPL